MYLPSISSHSPSPMESKGRVGGVNPCSSLVADKVVDTRALRTQSRIALEASGLGKTPGPAAFLKIPRQFQNLPASCLEIIAEGVKNAGF